MNRKIRDSILNGRLIGKYLAKGKPDSAREKIDVWIDENPGNQEVFDELRDDKILASRLEEIDIYQVDVAWKLLICRSLMESKLRVILYWKIAAVFIFVIGLGAVMSQYLYSGKENSYSTTMNTIVQTERGQTSKVILPDSTVVYLNSDTKIIYSSDYYVRNRQVEMVGEAYFEVHKDEISPFIVACNDFRTKVYGTKFNVNFDPDETNFEVILDEGKVELMNTSEHFNNTFLKPGERAVYNKKLEKINISKVDSYKYTSWKDGVLVFKDDLMETVFKKLEEWYDVDIQINDERIYDMKFNATIMDESMEELFELMKYSCGITYQIIYSRTPYVSSTITLSLN